ncbi:hypothetical protein DFH07DRAFT_773150 [Mycena maculata]|uniref:Uncharacterized protein n=1 Tax=Mycena maculata TaxID=230809 RepID=A0AAD7NCS9_9AGAR|nr:hypothetical protein DFH07DRAFT_773150 [Mycena maculata]
MIVGTNGQPERDIVCVSTAVFIRNTLPILEQSFHRVKVITIDTETQGSFEAIVGALHGFNAQNLHIFQCIAPEAPEVSALTSCPAFRASLAEIVLYGIIPPWQAGSTYANLTVLRLFSCKHSSLQWEQIQDVLTAATHLRILWLAEVSYGADTEPVQVLMPSLHKFSFAYTESVFARIITKIRMPNLYSRNLRAKGSSSIGPAYHANPNTFHVTRSITIEVPGGNDAKMDEILRNMRGACFLDLSRCNSDIIPILLKLAADSNFSMDNLCELVVPNGVTEVDAAQILKSGFPDRCRLSVKGCQTVWMNQGTEIIVVSPANTHIT